MIFVAGVIYLGLGNLVQTMPAVKIAEHDQLIIYSLSGCSACKEKRRELAQAGILYTEYVVDRDVIGSQSLMGKLQQAGFSSEQVGYPSFDVRGTLIPNNPSLIQIKDYLE